MQILSHDDEISLTLKEILILAALTQRQLDAADIARECAVARSIPRFAASKKPG
jgi:hypothetical protein